MFKLGMIGTGIIAGTHFAAIKACDDFVLAAVAEINEEKAKQVSAEQGVPYYLDYKEMCEKEELDAVIINLPHFLHCEATVFCLEHGISVLCEKPMANTVEECEKMMEAEKKSGKKLAIAHPMRYIPAIMVIKEYTESKTLGELTMVTEVRNEPYFLPSRPRWFLNKKLAGGGICMNFGAHAFDKLAYVIGTDFENINAVCGNFETDDDVEGHAQIYATANGVPVSITFSGYAPFKSNDATFFYTKGALRFKNGSLEICDEPFGEFRPFEYTKKYEGAFTYQLKEFGKLLRGEESICPDGEYGKKIIAAIEEVYRKGMK